MVEGAKSTDVPQGVASGRASSFLWLSCILGRLKIIAGPQIKRSIQWVQFLILAVTDVTSARITHSAELGRSKLKCSGKAKDENEGCMEGSGEINLKEELV